MWVASGPLVRSDCRWPARRKQENERSRMRVSKKNEINSKSKIEKVSQRKISPVATAAAGRRMLSTEKRSRDVRYRQLVTVLPLPNEDICLKKSILLWRISSEVSKGTISEKILDSLEMVEELDSISPMISSETAKSSMRIAYGYVVVASILSFNPDVEADDYYSAMQRIWTERINKMELVRSMGFFPRCWREVRKELEAVVVAMVGGERVHTYELRKEVVRVALESLRAFLVITARDLGLPFLGAVSGYVQWKYHDLDGFRRNRPKGLCPMPEDNISSPGQPPSNGCGPKQEASAALMQGDAPNGNGGVSHVPVIGDSNLGDGIRLMQTQAIHNVQAALKSSALNMQLAVEDPLPNALEMDRQMENKSKIGCEDRNSKSSKEIPHNSLRDPKTMGEATEIGHSKEPNTGNLRGTSSEGQCTNSHGRMI
ncbi:hypothetical protein EJ110_NYTH58263 [Nymphaea thermarum]|nr:hypothetical protein EJ110_NYTH58263 [Nymphaea thermarum]